MLNGGDPPSTGRRTIVGGARPSSPKYAATSLSLKSLAATMAMVLPEPLAVP